MLYLGLLHPEPLPLKQATVDPYLHRRHSNTQRQVWLSLCGVSWCAHIFLSSLTSLAGMGFDSKGEFAPPTILLGLLLCPWMWGIFSQPVKQSTAATPNPGHGVSPPGHSPAPAPHSHHLGLLEDTNRTLCTRTQEKGAVTPQETEPDLPVSVQESSVEAWVGDGLLQGWGH